MPEFKKVVVLNPYDQLTRSQDFSFLNNIGVMKHLPNDIMR